MVEAKEEDFSVGELVQDEEGHAGIVRYFGPVALSKKKEQNWVGVEWNDVGRGKYDGSVVVDGQTIRYFTCPAKSGSFVKPMVLQKAVTFMQALKTRYEAPATAGEDEHKHLPSGVRRSKGTVMQIEPVGMARIRERQQIHLLKEVGLMGMAVHSAGEENEIYEGCKGLRELDLADNLIDSWVTVGDILKQLPELEQFSLGNNRLTMGLPTNPIHKLPPFLKHFKLKVLVLNRTGTTLSQIQRLDEENALPCLEELVLGDNGLDTLDPIASMKGNDVKHEKGSYAEWAKEQIKLVDRTGFTPESFAKGFSNLRKIDISRNKLTSWSEVWRLSRLPRLKEINVGENPIDEIFFDEPLKEGKVRPILERERKDLEEEAAVIRKKANPPAWFSGKKAKSPEEMQLIEGERQRLAEEFAHKLETGEQQTNSNMSSFFGKAQDPTEIDIVMSNGIAVPIMEKREHAQYSDARLFKGHGTVGGAYPFIALEILSLSRTRVSSWTSIDSMDKFPSLLDLRLKECPVILMAASATAARQTVVARVAKLKRLNGSEVSERERSDAERLYLKRIAATKATANDADTLGKLMKENPRYDLLVATHGDPMAVAQRAQASSDGSLAATSVKVKISSFDPRSCTVPPQTKRLPAQMTVRELKALCHKLFGVDTELQTLFYREVNKDFGHPVHLDADELTVSDFGVRTDGEIIMEARDLEKETQDAEKLAAKEKALMQKQEQVALREAIMKREEIEQTKQGLSSVMN